MFLKWLAILLREKPPSSPIKYILFAPVLVSYFPSRCLNCILASLAIILCHTKIFLSTEIDYVKVLNRILPRDIRVLGWCPVPEDFHARLAMFHVLYCSFFLQGWMYYFANKHIWLYLLTSVNSKEIKYSIVFVIRLLCPVIWWCYFVVADCHLIFFSHCYLQIHLFEPGI